MTKPGDLPASKKTIYELAQKFPEKTYRELEKYRDADRQEEAQQIPLTESQKSQDKLEPIGMGHNRPPGETFKKACTLGEMRKDRNYPDLTEILTAENDKLKKRAQEAEGELSIIKRIGNTSPEMKEKDSKINELLNEIAALKETLKSKDYWNNPDYEFLVQENRELEQERNELLAKNKKLTEHFDKQVNAARKAGM
jgi:hypothetical protein